MGAHFQRAVLCLVLAAAGNCAAQPSPQPAAASLLQPVAWLVGGTWVSDVKSPDGQVTHVENNIEWAPNHQAIEFLAKFNGQPHYNGFYAYNGATKKISFYYTSSDGQLTIGTATPDPDGKTLNQEFDITQPDGKVGHVRSTVVRDGENAYWFTVFLQKNGEWSPEFKIHYERKP
jgi:hypothetical protein